MRSKPIFTLHNVAFGFLATLAARLPAPAGMLCESDFALLDVCNHIAQQCMHAYICVALFVVVLKITAACTACCLSNSQPKSHDHLCRHCLGATCCMYILP
ncbi:hypothetical protein COO60DRAFT_1010994 [Scenedesmus sp. NREL 46B-D3]|nr:hypothetical protein COO60DRAFT_1010994 [Scenedesmus sp. NREL 46B-D3]